MERKFLIVTDDIFHDKLIENLHARELELMSYDFELAGHEAVIKQLGDLEWDSITVKYKGLPRDAMIARALSEKLDTVTIQKIGDLNALELHKHGAEAVRSEIAKSERHHANLVASLPPHTLDAVATFRAKLSKKAAE